MNTLILSLFQNVYRTLYVIVNLEEQTEMK